MIAHVVETRVADRARSAFEPTRVAICTTLVAPSGTEPVVITESPCCCGALCRRTGATGDDDGPALDVAVDVGSPAGVTGGTGGTGITVATGVTAPDGSDAPDVPPSLVAVAVNVYLLPFARPDRTQLQPAA